LTQRLTLHVTRRAAGEIRRAAAWWEENRPLASGAVREELESAFALLQAQPVIGALAASGRAPGVRRLHLSRIHYYLYYRVVNQRIEVLAFWHTRRGSDPGL